MNTPKNCPQCGSPLPANTVRGLCPKCLALVALGGSDDKTLVIQAPPDEPPLEPALNPTLQYFGDYELLEEIARGGMGVVFKARQVRLNRIVAVKMILSGQLAAEAQVKRFYTEAEAAANLQHPNIVAIHEVGQHEGRHYFSMDYIEGKNLADFIKSNPPSPTQAAQLMKTISEAIHFAHQRGTLHRDLKPHNVLIDGGGLPHITDFGLAKRIEKDSGLTQSGAVMGSPAYMPPEQAAGKNDEVGPASDVYSLGAILYQMLTGKPPFSGETAVDTLRLVIEQEPIAPSKLTGNIPADLETICLKCLEKKPERRYSSARALAEELTRFLNHESILAKPASAGRKTWNWLVRHPWALTGAAAMLVLGLIGLAYGLWEQNQALKWSAAHQRGASDARITLSWLSSLTSNWSIAAMLAILFLNSLLLVPFVFADFVDRKRRNMAMAPFHLRIYAWIAVVEILFALALTFATIHDYVWNGLDPLYAEDLALFGRSLTIVPPIWFGALLLWHVTVQMRRVAFGVEQPDDQQLFPPRQDYWTVEQHQALNVLLLSLGVVFLAGVILRSEIFFGMAMISVIATTLLLGYRTEKTANRSLRLFLGILLGSITVWYCWDAHHHIVYFGGSPLDRLMRQWTASWSALVGIVFAYLIFRWNRRRISHTPSLASIKLWPVYHKAAQRIMLIQFFVLYPMLGPAAGCALFPFLVLLWRSSDGAEKRANGMTTCAVAILVVILRASFHGMPSFLWSALIGLSVGCLVIAILFFLEKQAWKKLAVKPS